MKGLKGLPLCSLNSPQVWCAPQVEPSIIYVAATGENIQPQGGNIAPALISIAPVRKQVGSFAIWLCPWKTARARCLLPRTAVTVS